MEAAPLSAVPPVPEMAKPGTDTQGPTNWDWVEASVWTDRMLAALVNGVQGGKWYSLMDKVVTPSTLEAAGDESLPTKAQPGWMGSAFCASKPEQNTTW
jgi:RNA-directed DNA polymerase